MFKRLNDYLLYVSRHPKGVSVLSVWSCTESFIFPIPPDIGLALMGLARRSLCFYYALVTTISSVIGGLIGYMIGYYLFTGFAEYLIELYGFETSFESFVENYNDNGNIIVFIGGFTPIPYKLITISSGVTGLSLPSFIFFSIISRGLRYFLISFLVYFLGSYAESWIEKYFFALTMIVGLILVVLLLLLANIGSLLQ